MRTHQELVDTRWTPERAKAYMEPLGVIKGVNFIPSYCYSYIEMWQHYREDVIRRELNWAKDFGLNSLRIFVASCQWETRKEQTCGNLDRFLDLASGLGFTVMLTLQPNTYMIPGNQLSPEEDPFVIHFVPSGHDKSWIYKGARIFDTKGLWVEDRENIAAFVNEIVARYGQDPRVTFWDLYNEPWEEERELLEMAFSCARDQQPMQPLTSCWRSFDISDITTFHCYEQPGRMPHTNEGDIHYMTFERELDRALSCGRPTLCTECMARTFGNELKAFLPYYSRNNIGFYVWGLCAGSAQYHFPWDWPVGAPAPRRWFHCLMYPDGTPFDLEEKVLIREYTYTGNLPTPAPVSGND